jgi:hypothetical protein
VSGAVDQDLLDAAAHIRRLAEDLDQLGEQLGSRRLRAVAAKLDAIPVLLEVPVIPGGRRIDPDELLAEAARLRTEATLIVEAL